MKPLNRSSNYRVFKILCKSLYRSLQEERSKNQAKDKLILDLQKNNSYLRSDVDKANIRAHEAEKECKSFQRLWGKLYVKR